MRYPFIILMNSHLIPKMIKKRDCHLAVLCICDNLIGSGCKRITLFSLCHLICVRLYMHVQIPRWNCHSNLLLSDFKYPFWIIRERNVFTVCFFQVFPSSVKWTMISAKVVGVSNDHKYCKI